MDSRFPPSPLHGAAYKWFLDRANVGSCSTPEALAAVRKLAAETAIWSAEPANASPEVHAAYVWAGARIVGEAIDRLKVFENSRAIHAAHDAMPKPPEDQR